MLAPRRIAPRLFTPVQAKAGGVLVHAFDVLGDPVRRRILELLAAGERTAGTIVEVVEKEFGISQAAVSQHLRVLRETGFAKVRIDGPRRVYSVDSAPLQQVDAWLGQFRGFWEHRLKALTTEIARGKRERLGQKPRAGSGRPR
jgi:DNA-binding transcriptional ArsR family regulator